MDLRFYLSRFLRQAHWFLLVLVLFAVAGLVAARILPTVYVASALMVVESEQIPDALAQSTVQTQASEQLQIIEQRILAREKLLEVANRLKIYDVIRAGAERPLTAGEIVRDMRSRVDINTTFDRGGGNGTRQATLVRVSFDAPEPQMAAAVTNELVTLILEEDVEMRTVVARQTLEFFQQEVERLEQALAERSGAIVAFKEKNLSSLPDSLQYRREEVIRLESRVAELEREEIAITEQIDRLARLRGQSDVSSEDVTEGTTGGVTTRDIRRDDLTTQLRFIGDEKRRLEARVLELTTTISQTPGNAVLLEALEREYENIRTQYNTAVANRAKAETGETIEALSKGQRITVIEQAVAPDRPEKPNRPMIMAAGVGAGMMAGLALVAVLEFLRGAIRRPSDLTTALGITPLATLPYVSTLAEKQRNWLLMVAAVVGLVLTVVIGLWVVHAFVMPLDLMVERLLERLPLWMQF